MLKSLTGPRYFLVIARDSAISCQEQLIRRLGKWGFKRLLSLPCPSHLKWFPVAVQTHDSAASSEFYLFCLSPWYFVHTIPPGTENNT